MNEKFDFEVSDWEKNEVYLNEYISGLPYPMESYMEDQMVQSTVYSIHADTHHVGFAAKQEDTLYFFYLKRKWLRFAQAIFEQFIDRQGIKSVVYQTSDVLLSSLVSDWEYEKKKEAYFFIDGGPIEKPSCADGETTFHMAGKDDIASIIEETGDFFDNLEKRIEAGTIFMLRNGDKALMGCGIVECSRFFKGYASIGMITCKAHRNKGVGRTILWHLKEFCYENGLKPVAGCWYYNTISRRTLEKAGMIPVARGMEACLQGKEAIPERTGNPPGEEV